MALEQDIELQVLQQPPEELLPDMQKDTEDLAAYSNLAVSVSVSALLRKKKYKYKPITIRNYF